jgi:hypothetical protein
MKIIALAAVVILLSTPFLTRAQNGLALGKQIETSLKAKGKKRKLKESIPVGNHSEQRWSSEGKSVLVLVYELGSPEEASENLRTSLNSVAYADINEPIYGFGDEAYLVSDSRGISASISFRRGRSYIAVTGNLKLVKVFARDIADYLARN